MIYNTYRLSDNQFQLSYVAISGGLYTAHPGTLQGGGGC